MPQTVHLTSVEGGRGELAVHVWPGDAATFVVALAHGYAEHARRYDHVAAALVTAGAEVRAPDHWAHGATAGGERAVLEDLEDVVGDFARVVDAARAAHPGLPLLVLGHSMGGAIAARYAQRFPDGLDALALSAPFVANAQLEPLREADPMPAIPLDPAALSRDPAVGEAYVADPLVYSGPLHQVTLRALLDAGVAVRASGPVTVPTLWLHGEEDPLAPFAESEAVVRAIVPADALTERRYSGARHEIFNETNRDEVIGDLVAWATRTLGVAAT